MWEKPCSLAAESKICQQKRPSSARQLVSTPSPLMNQAMADHEYRNAAHQAKKASLACEKCRILKVKCIRVEGQPCTKYVAQTRLPLLHTTNICRCSRSNSECIVPEPKQQVRPRRAKP
jgi:hypothetical protein